MCEPVPGSVEAIARAHGLTADRPPSGGPTPDIDEMAAWIVLETTDAKWADLTERQRNQFRRAVRLVRGR